MPEGIPRGFVVATKNIGKKDVFPRPSSYWSRLYLAEADVAQSKHAEGLKQHSRHVLQGKGNGALIGPLGSSLRLANEQKSRVVLLVVFDSGQQYPSTIFRRRTFGSDSGGIRQPFADDMTNAARSVIKRYCLNLTMSAEKIPALIKRHRMRKHPPYIAQLHSRRRDQIVSNAQMHLAVDKDVT